MIDLDNEKIVKEADKGQVAESIQALPEQIAQAWQEAKLVEFSDSYKNCNHVLIAGMGGSALGPELINYLFQSSLKTPVSLIRDYELPAFANQNTLVILSSYSGTTEEVLSVAKEAVKRGCCVAAITEGKDLGELVREEDLPAYIFDAKYNPSQQPRLGLGYSVAGLLGFFEALGLVSIDESEVASIKTYLNSLGQTFSPSVKTAENKAKALAKELSGSSVAIIAGEFLRGNAHIFANQINENAKNFAVPFLLSELNHHLLEGLDHPTELKGKLKFICLVSKLYSEKIAKRAEVTKAVLEKQGYSQFQVDLSGSTKLSQVFEGILISSWTSYYLGLLNEVDPAKIPWVDYFKEQLAQG